MAIFFPSDCFIVVHGSPYSHVQLLFTRLLDEYQSVDIGYKQRVGERRVKVRLGCVLEIL